LNALALHRIGLCIVARRPHAAVLGTALLVSVCSFGCEEASRPAKHAAKDPVFVEAADKECVESAIVSSCETACDGGVMRSCTELGRIYELGLNVTRDGIAAAALYRRACDGGDMAGCYSAAYVLENGIAGRRDARCAVAMYEYACNGGYARGCLMAGFMYKSGVDVGKDDASAAEAFKKACAAGNEAGCKQLEMLGAQKQ
jgi:TPR repeat protein